MLVCNVSLRPARTGIAADIEEAAAALDDLGSGSGQIVFATLVDDPASVGDFIDAYLGEIMLEAASAADAADAGLAYAATIVEATASADTQSGTVTTAPAGTTFNPSDKSANCVLTNGNLSADSSSGTVGVRATTSKSSGKWYFEVTWVGVSFSVQANSGCGVATSTAPFPLNGNGVVSSFLGGGYQYVDGTYAGSDIGQLVTGNRMCCAVDLDNKRMWMRRENNSWNGSGTADPATNVGGLNISSLFTSNAAYPHASIHTSGSAGVATINFGATAFAFTAPSGFSAWG